MAQRVEAWGSILEFPDDMADADIAAAISKNEAHLNPEASMYVKGKAAVSSGVDAGLSMFAPKKSIADQAVERSAETAGLSAPQVQGAPVRRDFYNRMVAETPEGSSEPDAGIVSRTRNAAANDKKAQSGKRAVAGAIASTEPEEEIGLLGTLKEGAKGTARNIGAAIDTYQGDEADVVSASRDASDAPKDPALSALLADIEKRKKALGEDPGWLESIGTVGGAAMSNPRGAGLLLAEQLPNSAAALGAGAAGAAAGSVFGPAGTVIGGIAGLFGANTALETGGKAIEAAGDGSFPSEEQSRVLKEGAIKGGVITTIDAATLGLTNFIMGTTRRAVERATVKTLTDQGIDVTNKAAVLAASKSPEIVKSVKEAQELAQKASTTLGHNLARVGGATGLETVGEGAGEYLGEYAATGKADKVEAIIEAFSSLGQSAGEIAFTAARNKAKLETIAGKPVTELPDNVLKYTANRGGERAKAAAQAELNRRATEGVDADIANASESTSEAVDRIISTGRDKADEIRETRQAAPDAIQDDVFDEESDHIVDGNKMVEQDHIPDVTKMVSDQVADAGKVIDAPTPERIETLNAQMDALAEGRKPGVLLTPGEPMPDALPEGVQAAEIPGRGTLLYRDDATLQAALEGRDALGYGIDEKPAGATQVVTARDANGTVIQDVATDGRPEVDRAAAAVAGESGTVEVRPVQDAMAEREANTAKVYDGKGGTVIDEEAMQRANLAKYGSGKKIEQEGMDPAHANMMTEAILRDAQASFDESGNFIGKHKFRVIPKRAGGGIYMFDAVSDAKAHADSYGQKKDSAPKEKRSVVGKGDRGQTIYQNTEGVRSYTESGFKHTEEPGKPRGEDFKTTAELEAGPARETRPAPKLSIESEPREAKSPAGAESVADETEAVHPIRSHVESLIKRRAPAKQGGKDLSNAIDRAKEVMEGKREPSTVEHRYFRLQAKAFEKADAESAKILRQIAGAVKPKESSSDAPKFSRAPNKEDVAFANEVLTELAGVDELFRYKVSHKTSLKGVFADVFPKAEYLGDGTRADERDESGADRRYVFKSPHNKQFYVYERDNGEIFINIADFSIGERGQAVYAAVANYAYNTNKKFIGDPAGLTGDSLIRRTSNMLSSALRFGTTKHLEAADQQIAGDPKNGVEPLDWSGNDVAKTEALIHTFITTLHNKLPEIKGYKYDFSTGQFVDRRGRPVGPDRFTHAEATGVGGPARAGKASMRRGILIQSLISGSGGARSGILEQVLNRSSALVRRGHLEGIFSRHKEKAASKQATKQGGLSVSDVQKFIEPLQQAGFKKINIAATQNDLPQKIKEQIKSQKAGGVRGVYIPAPDEIWLVADQLNDAFEVFLVTMHEARHRGLRKMFGPGIEIIMRQIYATNKRVREAADRMMKAHEGMSKETAVEEVLADMSVDRVRALNGWKKLVRFIQQWIAEKFDITFTDAMVEQLVAGAEVVGMAENEVSLFDEKQAEAYGEASDGARFSRKPSQPSNSASWDSPEPSKLDNLIYSLQNKHIDMKRVMESVRASGQQLAEKFDAYLQEELFHGRAAKRTKDFVNSELKPLIAGLKLRGLSIDELDKYLHARHAEEANALIAQRDPNMPDGGSGMTNQEAKDYFANLPADKKRKLEQTAKKVDDIITQTRDLYVSYGLISQAEADGWAQMFKHYVPLMREDKDGGMGIGQGFSIKGKEAKPRTGSKRAVVDILANIALQREKAIVRGEKNRVAVSLAGLVKLNPNPDFWTFDKVPTERVMNEATGLVEERPVPMFKSRDNVVVAKIKDSKGNVIERAVIFNEGNERAMRMAQAIKNLDATQLEGLMGVSAKVTRYFAAINTQYNPVFGIVNLTRDLQASLLNLSSTPIAGHKAAVLGNIIPAIRAIYASSRGERKGNQSTSVMSALWDEMQKEGGMTGYRDLFKTSEDRANAIKRELDPTAWMNSGLGKIFTAGGALKVPLAIAQKRAGWLFDWLSDYNQTLEGAMRLSVYKVAIDKGLSKARAASIAKNISVNFNRKGQSGQQAGALYAFFNAAMQGTARIGETMTTMDKGDIKTFRFNKAGKQIIVGGISLGAVQALALAAAGFDDDEPPEFVRERSLIIPIGDKKYVTVPMPLGFHAIPNIGRISTEFAMGGFKKPAEHTMRLAAVFAEAFNPIGSAGFSIQTIAPTAIDPLVALSENKDWTGKPIAKEDFNKLSPTPGFSRNKDTASDPAKWIAEAINTISGGNRYVPGVFSPTADQIDYLAGQVTGGVGRESGKAQQSVSAVLTGEDLPPHKIPLVGRFFGDSENSSSQGNAFYSNLKRINELEAELKGRRKDRLPLDEFKAENPEYRLVERANLIQRLVSKQRKIKSELIEKDAPREQVKAVEERITKLMTGFNVRVKELREEAR